MSKTNNKKNNFLVKYLSKMLAFLVIIIAFVLVNNRSKFRMFSEFEKEHFAVHEGKVSNIHYKVGNLSEVCNVYDSDTDYDYTKNGYYVNNTKNEYHIMLGQKSSGGYDLFVTKIKKREKRITITVKEVGPGEIAPQWITCPSIKITFDNNPGKVEIRDTNGNIFNKLN